MTQGEVVAEATAVLGNRREARLVVAAALGVDPAQLLGWPERAVAEEAHRRAREFVRRRAAGEPLSRLRGTREFWGLSFELSPETLDPRPDSETIVAAALEAVPDRAARLRVLDFGTGTGCLLLALLSELPNAHGIGLDRAPGAARTARRNAAALGLASRASFLVGDWAAAISGRFDLIVSNPPYIARGDIAGLAPEVQHDPLLALDGGSDALDAYRRLAPEIARLIGGTAVLELGAGQAGSVGSIMRDAGLDVRGTRPDIHDLERALILVSGGEKPVGKRAFPV
jgi:release factor glutamine methyltransferase